MSVRQYIGARYVPIFADPIQWDDTREYEPLTIVLYQGDSYTSKQAVPVGVNILNEDYWALTGNFNAQVVAYRDEVLRVAAEYDGLVSDVEDLGDRTTTNEGDIDTLESDVSALGNRVTTNEGDIDTLESGLSTANENIITLQNIASGHVFENKDIVCVQDSWGDETNGSWNRVTYNWMHMLCDSLHANYIDLHFNGAGFNGAWNGKTYLQVLNEWAATKTQEYLNGIPYVFVQNSINDGWISRDTVVADARTYFARVRELMPNATIYFFKMPMPLDPYYIQTLSSSVNYNIWSRVAQVYDLLQSYDFANTDIVYITNTHYSLYPASMPRKGQYMEQPVCFNPDNAHPTQVGEWLIFREALKVLTGNATECFDLSTSGIRIFKSTSATFTSAAEEVSPNNLWARAKVVGKTLHLDIQFALNDIAQYEENYFYFSLPNVCGGAYLTSQDGEFVGYMESRETGPQQSHTTQPYVTYDQFIGSSKLKTLQNFGANYAMSTTETASRKLPILTTSLPLVPLYENSSTVYVVHAIVNLACSMYREA